jgi:hypothetical protein
VVGIVSRSRDRRQRASISETPLGFLGKWGLGFRVPRVRSRGSRPWAMLCDTVGVEAIHGRGGGQPRGDSGRPFRG